MKKVDPNKMHLEELQNIMQNVDPDEARSICKIMVRRYPEVVLTEFQLYIKSMQNKINGLYNIIGGAE